MMMMMMIRTTVSKTCALSKTMPHNALYGKHRNTHITYCIIWNRLWRPRSLTLGSTTALLLGLRIIIPPKAWLSVNCECCVLSVEIPATGRSLVQRRPTESVCVTLIACNNDLYTYNEYALRGRGRDRRRPNEVLQREQTPGLVNGTSQSGKAQSAYSPPSSSANVKSRKAHSAYSPPSTSANVTIS